MKICYNKKWRSSTANHTSLLSEKLKNGQTVAANSHALNKRINYEFELIRL